MPVQTEHRADRAVRSPGLTVWDAIGNTPLLQFSRITAHLPEEVSLYAKAEWLNPGGSVKDRPARNIIRKAEQRGDLTPDRVLLDASSGNTAIAYAMLGAARGYQVRLCLPENADEFVVSKLRAYGADLVFTDASKGSDGAIVKARELKEKHPDHYFYADQYNNPDNWRAHYQTTGNEIWRQTEGRVTHFVAGLGTSGTFTGTGRRLRAYHPDVKLVSVEPALPLHGLEGLKHMKTAIVPGIYDRGLADVSLSVSTEDAQQMVKRLFREEGFCTGLSSGAAVIASLDIAERLESGTVVTILPDGGGRYLDQSFWEE